MILPLEKFSSLMLFWVIPKITPSKEKMSEVETTMATSPKVDMTWPALNVFREQPPKQKEIRVQLASTIHRPERVIVGLQKVSRTT